MNDSGAQVLHWEPVLVGHVRVAYGSLQIILVFELEGAEFHYSVV